MSKCSQLKRGRCGSEEKKWSEYQKIGCFQNVAEMGANPKGGGGNLPNFP